jgi:histidinol-phosphate/aromatic aminotransferase/cobyric acid decarboxylase-like protein
VGAVAALKDPAYYERRHAETAVLRAELAAGLREIGGLEVLEGCANFILFHLGETDPDAATVAAACRERGLHLREAGLTSPVLGRTALRIAVKDRRTQARMLKVLARVLREIRRGR